MFDGPGSTEDDYDTEGVLFCGDCEIYGRGDYCEHGRKIVMRCISPVYCLWSMFTPPVCTCGRRAPDYFTAPERDIRGEPPANPRGTAPTVEEALLTRLPCYIEHGYRMIRSPEGAAADCW